MLKIRLKRTGRRNNPSFRIIVTESTNGPKSGKAIDVVGFYNAKEGKRKIDPEKALKWISEGAQPSDTVHNMLISEGIIKGKKINVLPQKSPVIKEKEEVKDTAKPKTEEEKGVPDEESAEDIPSEASGDKDDVKEAVPDSEAPDEQQGGEVTEEAEDSKEESPSPDEADDDKPTESKPAESSEEK